MWKLYFQVNKFQVIAFNPVFKHFPMGVESSSMTLPIHKAPGLNEFFACYDTDVNHIL